MVHQSRLDNTLYHKTKNARGYMHPISLMGEKFIQFSKIASPVLDMGCAYGSIVLKALDEGAKKIIACDMEQKHLDILRDQLSETESQRVEILKGLLPNGFNINPDSIAGIYISHVLEYLNGREVGKSLENFYRWLKPGGKLFIKCYTIYIKEFMNEKCQTEYQNRLKQKVKWPGYFEDINQYSYLEEGSETSFDESAFPESLHMFDLPILVNALQEVGFKIDYAEYLDGRKNHASEETWYDGREYVGVIAVK